MEATAVLSRTRLSEIKGRLVADQIRGLKVSKAVTLLNFNPRKAAKLIKKLLESAIANAEHNEGADIDDLYVSVIHVERGSLLKRVRARAKGRGNRLMKPTSNIFLTVSDKAFK